MPGRVGLAAAVLLVAATTTACTALFPFGDPASTCLLGVWEQNRVQDVAVLGDFAFVASGDEVLALDVSVPGSPNEIGAFQLLDCDGLDCGEAVAIAASGAKLVVGTNVGAVIELDPGAPTTLSRVGYVGPLGGPITDVAVAEPWAWVAHQRPEAEGAELLLIQLGADEVDIHQSADLEGNAAGLFVGDLLVAVAAGGSGVVPFSNPTEPVHGETLDTPGSAQAVTATEDGWLVADQTALRLVRSGREPSTLLDRDPPGLTAADFLDVVIAEGRAVVAAGAAGLLVVDPREKPAIFTPVPQAAPALRLVVDRGRAYVARGDDGLAIVDLACAGE